MLLPSPLWDHLQYGRQLRHGSVCSGDHTLKSVALFFPSFSLEKKRERERWLLCEAVNSKTLFCHLTFSSSYCHQTLVHSSNIEDASLLCFTQVSITVYNAQMLETMKAILCKEKMSGKKYRKGEPSMLNFSWIEIVHTFVSVFRNDIS